MKQVFKTYSIISLLILGFHAIAQDNNQKRLVMKQGISSIGTFSEQVSVIGKKSGRITGVLIKSDSRFPSNKGTLVYLNAYPELQKVLDRVEKSGGKVITTKTEIPAAFIAIVEDTEGNHIGLHAEK
ncbi:hypothetical protein [Olivibacter sitiensis]|uniref:hypothetical protein n=1 Tax=Olivibacter sitiensis TaxID=376470 RepID=UPI0006873614|nr:hypothetical protein [Olivibacter sitiensis]